jgi:ferredoxin-NADP reductase
MSSSAGLLAGVCFVALAAVNGILALEASRAGCSQRVRAGLMLAHRVGGYLFAIFFCIMAFLMSKRLIGVGLSKQMPMYLVVHIALTLALAPLLLLKILIARRYKQSHALLMPLGLAIFSISFVMVTIPSLSELLRSSNSEGAALKLTISLIATLCILLASTAIRAKKQRDPSEIAETNASRGSAKEARPMILTLSNIEQQTHDTKTFRFLVPREQRLRAKPGQFLTFRWNIDGKQVIRSYTISSSPLHSEYIEITPKRVKDGCVSRFLHDRAKLGLTVEATGPHGNFCFDERVHQSIVLVAAGSGITPMIAMLRYIDDLGLSTSATLLYCVRTRQDIIFAAELKRLRDSLPNFHFGVCLSEPDATWTGCRGHFTREFLLARVPDLHSPTFFLCGPPGFMQNARQILNSLGVNESRITQESFGGTPVFTALPGPDSTVKFVLSQKTCTFPAVCTLLEVAESNGVQIPFSCRQGQCGTCATRLLSGAVHMESGAGLTTDQKQAGYVLPCVSRAKGPVVVEA